jgi:hypothetical protein
MTLLTGQDMTSLNLYTHYNDRTPGLIRLSYAVNPSGGLKKRSHVSMKKAFIAVVIITLVNLIASAQIPSDTNLRLQIDNSSATNCSGIISNTQPDVQYEFQYKQSRTNWISLGFILGSEITNWTTFDFPTTNTINRKRIRIRSWKDSDGNGIADWWELRYFGTVGVDPYGNPAGDGWNNMQKFQNGMNPFQWCLPGGSDVDLTFQQGSDIRHENNVLTWRCDNGPVPDFFIVERANRKLRRGTNNLPPYRYLTNGRIPTNRPPFFHPANGQPGWPPQDSFATGPYEIIARLPGHPNVREYRYMDTNVDAFPGPVYHVRAHYPQPVLFAELHNITTETVRKTILHVTAKQETNGYALTILHPAIHVRYLLLVRDKNDKQWRASGYFVSGTNGNPVYLHVDKKGMMSEGQSPIAMPAVKCLSDVIQPEFTAGYGEDSDGDLLPDIYEVLVTHTDPANDDTEDTGVIDGFKKMTGDGVSNFEKFCCRVDPLRPTVPPAPIELKHPTGREIMGALLPTTDLSCELQIEIRTNNTTSYQPIEQAPWMFSKIMNIHGADERKNFDVRISWHFSKGFLDDHPHENLPAEYRALEPLMGKINLELFKAFKANLETNPPLSPLEMSNKMTEVMYSYREGGIDKGIAMAEMMLLQNYQSQSFYGKIIDQNGSPVADVDVTGNIVMQGGLGDGVKNQTYKTKSDADGLFEFTGKRGWQLNVIVKKDGYLIGERGEGYKGPPGGKTTPADRAILTMWKIHGAEPLNSSSIDAKIPHDGTPTKFDIATGKVVPTGDFCVTLSQFPLEVKTGREKFDWTAKIEVISGGLIEEKDPYPYWAPVGGYQQAFEFTVSSNALEWAPNLKKNFYIKTVQGQYGLMQFSVYSGRSPTALEVHFTMNPSGSQNLEPAQAK